MYGVILYVYSMYHMRTEYSTEHADNMSVYIVIHAHQTMNSGLQNVAKFPM